MEPIDLNTAVGEIKQACEDFDESSRKPFFFIVGAGISAPTVPLASELQSQCMAIAKKHGRTSEPAGALPLETYSHWLEKAFPQPKQRQTFLRELIHGKPISQANFRLAHLLLDKSVSNLVVTPNFDDFVSRALTLFGEPHIVCDHPRTVERINPEEDDIQIVHVHGSYWFYDCCNLRGELEQRAELSSLTTLTMASLLDNIFSHRSPIVVGYSGWEGDVIMRSLRRHLVKNLAYKLYWFCYGRPHIAQLPDWLKSHSNVQLVVPPEVQIPEVPTIGSSTSLGSEESEISQPASNTVPSADRNAEPTLSAQQVFDALIERFGLPAPELTRDPLAFFVKHLRSSLPGDASSEPASDIYLIRDVIERVERANTSDRESAKNVTDPLEEVRNSLRRSRYREAVELGRSVNVDNLNHAQSLEFMDAMWSAARGLNDDSEQELLGYDLLLKTGKDLQVRDPDAMPVNRMATALLFKGITLGTLNRNEEAFAVYDELVKKFGDATEPNVREDVATAMQNKGFVLGTLNRNEEEIAVYDELVKKFGDATEPAIREQVAMAMRNKGIVLGTLNRSEEEIAVYDELVKKFGDATEPAIREQVAMAMRSKGFVLGTLNRNEEAIAVYDELVKKFSDATEPAIREQVARAMRSKGVRLGTLNRSEEAIAVYDELVKKFGDVMEPGVRQQVATAMRGKGVRLGTLNRNEEAIAVYDELVKKFSDATAPAIREQVAMAMRNKGLRLGTLNRSEEEIAVYDELVKKFADATEPAVREQVAKGMVNKGFRLGTLNRSEDEIAVYDELVKKFADATEPGVRQQVATAMRGKGLTLGTLNRSEEAIAVYDELVKKFADATEPEVSKIVKEASELLRKSKRNT